MPTQFNLTGVNVASPLLPPLPSIAGCLLWSYLGVDLAHSQNAIPGAPQFTQLGTPTYFSNYMRAAGPNGSLQGPGGGVLEPPAGTILSVFRYAAGGTTGTGGSIFSGNATQLGQTGSTVLNMYNGQVGAPVYSPTVATMTFFRFFAATYGGGVPVSIYDETNNQSFTGGPTGAGAQGTGTQWIGGNGSTNDRLADIAFCALYNSVLSKATIDQFYAHVKAVLKLRGITDPV